MRNLKKSLALAICLSLLAFASAVYAAGDDNSATGQASSTVNSSGNNATSTGAEVSDSNHSVAVGASVQVINGSGNDALSLGGLATTGDGNTATGVNAQVVDGRGLKAVGYSAVAGYGDFNTVIGNNTSAGGLNPTIRSSDNVAVGTNASATGGSSTAIRAGSLAMAITALPWEQTRKPQRPTPSPSVSLAMSAITNVAPGINGTDAVNMNQLWDTQGKINRLAATAMAMSGLAPMGYNPKNRPNNRPLSAPTEVRWGMLWVCTTTPMKALC
jgi:trimeric autotransporter adhesin